MDGIIASLDSGFSKLWQIVKNKEARDPAVHGANTTERMNNRTLPQRRHVDVQQAFEEMLNSVNHHTHANKNHNEIQNGCHQKEHSYEVLTRM